MSDSDRDEYITPGDAARRFGVSTRSIERAAASGKVRTRNNPRRKGRLYHLGDLEQWRGAETPQPAPPPAKPSTELVPPSELLRMLDDAQRRAERAMLEVGRLQGQLEAQHKLLEGAENDRQRLVEILAEREQVRRDIARLQWWIRLLLLRKPGSKS